MSDFDNIIVIKGWAHGQWYVIDAADGRGDISERDYYAIWGLLKAIVSTQAETEELATFERWQGQAQKFLDETVYAAQKKERLNKGQTWESRQAAKNTDPDLIVVDTSVEDDEDIIVMLREALDRLRQKMFD